MNERPPPQPGGGNVDSNDPTSRKSHATSNGNGRSEPKKSARLRRTITEVKSSMIGKVVIPHSCIGILCIKHGSLDNDGCVCSLIGQRVTIVDRVGSDARARICYSIEGSNKILRSDEFEEAPALAVAPPQAISEPKEQPKPLEKSVQTTAS